MSDKDQRKRELHECLGNDIDEATREEILSLIYESIKQERELERIKQERERLEQREQRIKQEHEQTEQRIKQAFEQAREQERELARLAMEYHDLRSLQTLMNATEDKFLVKAKCCSHTNDRNHAEAVAVGIGGFHSSSPDWMGLKKKEIGKYMKFQSRLLQDFEGKKNTYGSEADICDYIWSAVWDAVKILEMEGDFETGEQLHVYHERSFLGCRSDMMVVRDQDGQGLIVIDFKYPTESPLRTYSGAVGYAYDQVMSMNGTDIVLVSSFRQSFLGSLNAKDLRHKSGQTGPEFEGVSDYSNSQQIPDEEGKMEGFSKDGTGRVLYASEKDYGPHELVKLIYTALKIAKKTYKKSQKKIHKLEYKGKYSFSRALKVRNATNVWEWGSLTATVGSSICTEGTYFIIGSLCQGSTSNVFQALDHGGRLVALKVFVNRDYYQGQSLTSEDFDERAKELCEREKTALTDVYGFLSGKVHVIKICGYHALVMPIFNPIPKDDRPGKLEDIEAILKQLANENKRYNECLVRFRHVGTFRKQNEDVVVLFDFADLEEINEYSSPTKEDKEDAVKDQIEEFERRSRKDSPWDNVPSVLFGDVERQS